MDNGCITCALEHLGAAQVELGMYATDMTAPYRALHLLRLAAGEIGRSGGEVGRLVMQVLELRGELLADPMEGLDPLRLAPIMTALINSTALPGPPE